MDKGIEECRKRLRICVVAGGRQFEHKMWTFISADVLSCVMVEGWSTRGL